MSAPLPVTPPLVMVHGFMGGGEQWRSQKERLGADRPVVTVDLPGFAANADLEAPDAIAGFARFVWKELNKRNIGRIHLLGHSMGGMIVQEMLALEPERVEKLALYATASTGDLPGRFETFDATGQRVRKDGVSASARRISATWFLAYEAAAGFENCAAIAERASLQAVLAGLDAMKTWPGTGNLANIRCPTLILWGEADRTYRWPRIEALWNGIPNASLCVLPACAHAAHLEKPDLFNAALLDFLN